MSDEDGKTAKHDPLEFGKEPVTPVERRLQRPLPRRRGARPKPQQGQPLVKKRGGLLQPVSLDASGSQLDRERHAVELSADRDHDCRFRIAKVQASAACQRALDEQLGRGERPSRRRGEPRIVWRTGERIQPVDVLTLDPKSLAAGRQDVDLRRRHEDFRRQRRDRLNQMLASVEDQKHSLVAQIGDQAGRRVVALNRQPQHGGDRRGDQSRIAQHAEINEQHGARKGIDQMMSDRDGDRGFADAANAHDADKPGGGQSSRELENVIVAPDHSS